MNETQDSIIRGALSRCRSFSQIADSSVEMLVSHCRMTSLEKGDRLLSEGDPAADLILVADGRLRMVQNTLDGREILLATADPGECLSLPATLSGSRHRGDIVASSAAKVVLISARAVWETVEKDPLFARGLIASLSSEVLSLTDLLKGYALDVTARLAGTLFHLALESGRPVRGALEFTLEVKKGELAAELGVAPETLSRSFAKLKAAGLLSSQGGIVTVYDLKSLAALASGFDS